MKKLLFVLVTLSLLVLTPKQAAAAPTLIGGALKTGYITGDQGIGYGYEIELSTGYYPLGWFFQQLVCGKQKTQIVGCRFYFPIDEPYRLSLGYAMVFRSGTAFDSFSLMILGADYCWKCFVIGSNLGIGLSNNYPQELRFAVLFQLKAGIHWY